MKDIFKRKKGKDFYRDTLGYMEYDPLNDYKKSKNKQDKKEYIMDNDEISYYIETKLYKLHQLKR
jgi:hypothetical protein